MIFISLWVPFHSSSSVAFFLNFLVLFHHQYLLSFPFFISFISITKLHSFFTSFSWDYFPHDHARSRAYRWGEDGLLGISDEECRLCFGLALWNEKDPILKERLFGLTGNEGTISVIILKENILEKKYRILQHKWPSRKDQGQPIKLKNFYRNTLTRITDGSAWNFETSFLESTQPDWKILCVPEEMPSY